MTKFYKNTFFAVTFLFFAAEGCFAGNNGDYDRCVEAYEKVRDEMYLKNLKASVENFLKICGNPNFTPDFEKEGYPWDVGRTLCDLVYEQYKEYEGQASRVVQQNLCMEALNVVTNNAGLPGRSIMELKKMCFFMKVTKKGSQGIKRKIMEEVEVYRKNYFKTEERPSAGILATKFLTASFDNKKKTLLHFAAYYGNDTLFKLLVKDFKLNVNILDGDKQSPIYSLFEGASTVKGGGRRNYDKILKFLFRQPNLRLELMDDEGKTIKQYASRIYENKKKEYSRYVNRNMMDTASISKKSFMVLKQLFLSFEKLTAPKKTLKERFRGFWTRKKGEDPSTTGQQKGEEKPIEEEWEFVDKPKPEYKEIKEL